MGKEITFKNEAREQLSNGINILANAVKVTLGPKGKNVLIQKQYGNPHITKDGVTVAKSIVLDNPIENMAAQLVKEVASQVAYLAGDGTSTATVLTQSIYNEGLKLLNAGYDSTSIKKGIDKAVIEVVELLNEFKIPVENNKDFIKQVASISANNDDVIGSLIAEAMKIAGNNGIITIEKSKTGKTYVKEVTGTEFDNGYLSPYFATDTEKLITEFTDAYILICNYKIQTVPQIIPVLEEVMEQNKPLLIIADDISPEVLTMLVRNKVQSGLEVVAVKPPGFGDRRKAIMEDLAITTGSTVISEDTGITLESIEDLSLLGSCEKVTVTKDSTTIIKGAGEEEAINKRVLQVKSALSQTDFDYDTEKLQERLSKLLGKAAVLYLGAHTELELGEKKDRVDDALAATKAAVEEGVIPSGATVFVKISKKLISVFKENDVQLGYNVVKKSLLSPITEICKNAEVSYDIVIEKVLETSKEFGYNARVNEIQNLVHEGIIDPLKVSRVAIEKASSIASTLLTTECTVVEKANQ